MFFQDEVSSTVLSVLNMNLNKSTVQTHDYFSQTDCGQSHELPVKNPNVSGQRKDSCFLFLRVERGHLAFPGVMVVYRVIFVKE